MKSFDNRLCRFIGFHLTLKLLKLGKDVVGIDNLNNYYDPKLKFLD